MITPRIERALGYLLLALVLGVYVVAGLRGLDYGPHVDEWYAAEAAQESVGELTFFPGRYVYNHLYFLPSTAAVVLHDAEDLPAAVVEIFERPGPGGELTFDPSRYPSLARMQDESRDYVGSRQHTLDTRRIFLLLTLIGPLAVFFCVLAIRPRGYLVAAAAAAFLGLSFEVLTHARWIAVDALQMSLVALELLLLAHVFRPDTRLGSASKLLLASGVAGLCLGCKMTGLLAILPVAVAPFLLPLTWPAKRERALLFGSVLVVALGVFLLTTPGALQQPFHLLFAQAGLMRGYGATEHPHSVNGLVDHASKLVTFLGFYLGSPSRLLAAAMAVVSLLGLVVLARVRRRLFLLWALFSIALLALLLPRQLLFVRNYLQLAPLIAVAFALGLGRLGAQLRRLHASAPYLLGAATAAAFAFNAADLLRSAETIRDTTAQSILEETRDYLLASDQPFRISPRLADALGPELEERYFCSRLPSGEPPERVVMYYADHDADRWLSNRVGFVERVFGPRDASYDWYATWRGRHEASRVVVLPARNAERMDVPLSRFLVCRGRGTLDAESAPSCGEPPTDVITLEDLLVSMTDLDAHLAMDETVVSVRLASSYDRRAHDGDWFANRDRAQYLAVEGEERVLFDARGPGVITRFGSANPSGNLRVEVDGELVLEGPMAEVLAAEGLPVGDDLSFIAARGHNLYLPIPYQDRCRVTVDTRDGLYYQLTYRTYAPSTRVEPFSAGVVDRAICNLERRATPAPATPRAIEDPGRLSSTGPSRVGSSLDSATAGALELRAPRGGGRITELRVEAGGLSDAQLRGTELTMVFDGETTVRAPLGDFFHGGPGLRPLESLRVTVEEDGTLIARWPMPFARTARLALRAANAEPATIPLEVIVEPAPFSDETLIFHAHWRPPTPIQVTGEDLHPIPSDFRVAEVTGRGLYVGMILDVADESPSWWGEGDEKIFVDGEAFPSHFGTGTEDYFGWAWCSTEQFARPFVGQIRSNTRHNGGYLSAYRWLGLDAIPFRSSLTFDFEALHWDSHEPNLVNDWDSVAFFYLAPGAHFAGPEISDADFRIPELPPEILEPGAPGERPYGCGQGQGPGQ